MTHLRVGCNSVLFSMTDLDTALQHIAWAGYDGAELAYIPGMVEHVQPNEDPRYAQHIRDYAASLGLALYAIEATPNQPERIENACKIAQSLGIPIVAIGSGGKTGDEESFRQSITLGKTLAAIAKQYNIVLALKPHVGAAVYNTETALHAWRAINSPHLGLNFDPSHLLRAGEDVVEAAKQFTSAGAIVHSHFRDCLTDKIGGPPGPPEEQIPGRGRIAIPAVLQTLTNGGYSGVIDLECIGAKAYPLSRAMGIAAETRGYLRCALQTLT